ncbi:uncharacterized protein T551_03603 [Pneumocystis jirovecii RU7]|uniref:Uncharacterized protein n=1 Tax=Pneumocystis jirovecii (strain RU7) TaxID=1408657 RepID=A0A0W4ZD75_PNEJ7|nr:uncharacterized protein T551_03603 [Pneumocystis jirovecii RU7]KTW26305.1 hypothetical protein T551_03603 [Pneumocystis jirovecii RU7]
MNIVAAVGAVVAVVGGVVWRRGGETVRVVVVVAVVAVYVVWGVTRLAQEHPLVVPMRTV